MTECDSIAEYRTKCDRIRQCDRLQQNVIDWADRGKYVPVSEITAGDKEIKSGTETTLTCGVSGVAAAVTFAWTDASSSEVTSTDGSYGDADGTQESTITVTPSSDTTYTCSVTNSDVAAEVTVVLNVFGKRV